MRYLVIGAHLRSEDVEPDAVALPAGPLFLSGIAVEDERALSDRELILEAAAVRARLTEKATFVAIRYGLAVRSAADGESRCSAHLARWRDLLERHRGEVEMTLKIAVRPARERPQRESFASGADYLRALHAATRAAAIDPSFMTGIDNYLRPIASRLKAEPRDAASAEVVMLVARERLSEIATAAEALKREHPDVPFLLSGPWPLEVFADADHE